MPKFPPLGAPYRPLDAPLPAATYPIAPLPPARPLEMLALVAIVALADIAIYWGTGGVGLAALLAGTALLLVVASEARRFSWRLVAIAGLFALVVLRALWQPGLGTTLMGPLLLVSLAVALRTERTYLPELAASIAGSAFGSFQQVWNFGASGVSAAKRARMDRVPWAALLVPAALVLVFGSIFAAANPLLRRALSALAAHLSLAWFPTPVRFIFWGICAVVASGLLRPAQRRLEALSVRLGGGHALTADVAPVGPPPIAIARNGMIALL